jgi:outer membrane protein assembly factor BamB
VIDGNLLVININEYGTAIDKRNGETVWNSSTTDKPYISQYATPIFFNSNGARCALIFGNYVIHTVDLSMGNSLWKADWEQLNRTECGADPIYYDGKVFVSTYDNGCALYDVRCKTSQPIWKNKNMSTEISSNVLVDGYIYGIDGKTDHIIHSLRCIDWESGNLMWERETKMATLTASDGKLIVLETKGTLYIVNATPKRYEEIARCDIPDQKKYAHYWTPPVLCNGLLYCRNNVGDLTCIDMRK